MKHHQKKNPMFERACTGRKDINNIEIKEGDIIKGTINKTDTDIRKYHVKKKFPIRAVQEWTVLGERDFSHHWNG